MSDLKKLCSPAIIYLIFSLTHIILDIFGGQFKMSFVKFLVMILFTILLNFLCKKGLGIISWIIVFLPFILMSLITVMVISIMSNNVNLTNIENMDNNSLDDDLLEGDGEDFYPDPEDIKKSDGPNYSENPDEDI
jgi:hypothetical protein